MQVELAELNAVQVNFAWDFLLGFIVLDTACKDVKLYLLCFWTAERIAGRAL